MFPLSASSTGEQGSICKEPRVKLDQCYRDLQLIIRKDELGWFFIPRDGRILAECKKKRVKLVCGL